MSWRPKRCRAQAETPAAFSARQASTRQRGTLKTKKPRWVYIGRPVRRGDIVDVCNKIWTVTGVKGKVVFEIDVQLLELVSEEGERVVRRAGEATVVGREGNLSV